jgi:hypothetical protein
MKISTNIQISRKALSKLPLIIFGAFLIIYISLGVMYYQKQADARGLDSQILLQTKLLQKAPLNSEKLRSQLKEATAEYEMTLTSLPGPEQGIDVYAVLVEMDRNSRVEVMSITAGPPITVKSGKGSETILPYYLVVLGKQSDLLEFIASLIQGDKLLQGLELKSIDIQNSILPGGSGTLNIELDFHTWLISIPETPAKTKLPGSKS